MIMRVLYIFRSIAQWGGIERILVDKMNYLSDVYGVDVFFLTYDQGSHSQTFKLSDNIHYEDLNICFHRQYKYSLLKRMFVLFDMRRKYKFLLSDRLCKICPDLIVTTTSDHLDIIIKVKGSVPLIVESHSICIRTINTYDNWVLRRIFRKMFLNCLSKADAVVALTESDADEWRKYHSNVVVIPNFVHSHKNCISELTSKNVLFVGRFDYQKRVQDAILIWKMVRERHPDYLLHIYGEGEMHDEITHLASSVGGIVVHQPTNRIFNAYQNSSILISTSLFEPFGLVIPEAMSCGVPVVAFDCNYGPSEFITENSNGFLIKDRDYQTFADRVCDLIESEFLRKKMGKVARCNAEKYDLFTIMPMWMCFFSSFISTIKKDDLDDGC